MNDFFKNQTVIFYIFLAISIVLSRLPIIGKYFIGINTLIHETGHALMALFLSGKVHRIDLSSDTSGSALTSTDNKFKSFLVSIIGYPFSSIIALKFSWFGYPYLKHRLNHPLTILHGFKQLPFDQP